MEIHELHAWDISPSEAAAVQRELRSRVSLSDVIDINAIQTVAGVDNTYVRSSSQTTAYAVVVVLDFATLEVVETAYASQPIDFPYVPGLLSFREAPAVLAAFREVTNAPDVVLFDGQGYAHPRRLGLASHLGLILDLPSIGCAKSRLVGEWAEPDREFGAQTALVHRGEVVGSAVRTRPSHAPLFVSPGYKVSVETAVEVTLRCCRDERFMPEPTRLAHDLITEHTRPFRKRGKRS